MKHGLEEILKINTEDSLQRKKIILTGMEFSGKLVRYQECVEYAFRYSVYWKTEAMQEA